MSLNRTAKGVVLVPSLLLGGAFLSAGVWLKGEAGANRPLAFALGGLLLAAGLLTQLLPENARPEEEPDPEVEANAGDNPEENREQPPLP